jgi:hypothetical protein
LWHRIREKWRGKKDRKGEKERKERVELVISMRVPSFFEIRITLLAYVNIFEFDG